MKTKLFFLLFLYNMCAFSQSLESLKIATKKIYDANYTMDFDAVANLTYPKVYEATGKMAFTEKLDADYQNDVFRKRLQIEIPVFQYSDMKTLAGKKYYIITYKNPIRYFFEQKMDASSAQKKAADLKQSAQAYEVVVEPKRNSINVKRNSKLIAISDETTNGEWTFINFDDLTQREFFDTFFEANVKKELGL